MFIQQTIIISIDVKTKRLAPYSLNRPIVQPGLCSSIMQWSKLDGSTCKQWSCLMKVCFKLSIHYSQRSRRRRWPSAVHRLSPWDDSSCEWMSQHKLTTFFICRR